MRSTATDALAAMHDRDRALGIDPRSIPRVPDPPMPAPPPPIEIPAPDWRAEQAAARERERAAQRAREARGPVREPDPAIHVEDTESKPAKPTPRLNKWRAMMRADRGDAA